MNEALHRTGDLFLHHLEDLGASYAKTLRAWWFDPRTGQPREAGTLPRAATHTFTPPSEGMSNDWVLVLDDAARGFGPPGKAVKAQP